ncbi:hypothetical protein LPJ61_003996, partial [Coemansia biformis]
WIPSESRRLLHHGKPDPGVAGSTEAMVQLEAECAAAAQDAHAAFDLAQAIEDAFGVHPDGICGEGGAAALGVDAKAGVLAEPAKPRPRGRPPGSRNRRRVGHIKNRSSRPRQHAASVAASKQEDGSSHASAPGGGAEAPTAPAIPAEMRIPAVRMARAAENPYMRRHQPEEIFGVASDGEATTGTRNAASAGAGHGVVDGADAGLRAAKTSRGSACESPGHAASDGAIWNLARGDYVTTGAFFTRRTVKSLAHSGSTGGIMQGHHGYYPGQLVEVMNANRTWYLGRVISYADRKFLIHFNGWDHSHDEWVAVGSKRMRAAVANGTGDDAEAEEDARKICVVLVNEYNACIDDQEKREAERADARRKARQPRRTPVNPRLASLTGAAMAMHVDAQNSSGGNDGDGEAQSAQIDDDDDDDEGGEDVEPISVDSGYVAVPQLLRVKDYVKLFRKGMCVAARDRNKLWWKAEITDIKTFRLRIHYCGFSASWDEWMEMNTQRIMFEDAESAAPEEVATGTAEDGRAESSVQSSDFGEQSADEHGTPATSHETEGAPASKRLGRPPGPETKSAPLSLRLALKTLMGNREMYRQCHPEESDVFHLPKEHMSTKDYSTFLKVGDRVRIRDRDKQWYECTIIDFRHGSIRVCFNGHSDEFNQWVPVNSDRIRVLRETIEKDKRLEKLERESQIAQRRKRERLRAQRRKRSQMSMASLIGLAESLEYIVGRDEDFRSTQLQTVNIHGSGDGDAQRPGTPAGDADTDTEDAEDRPLLQLMLETGGSEWVDSMPLLTRLLLAERAGQRPHGAQMCGGAGAIQDSATWFVYCNQCNIVIRTFRYYCMSCERPSDGYDYESYDLCLMCFSKQFPCEHPHPRASFARAAVSDAETIVHFTSSVLDQYRDQKQLTPAAEHMVDVLSGLLAPYELDAFDASYDPHTANDNSVWNKLAVGLHGTTTSANPLGRSAVLGKIVSSSRRIHPARRLIDAGDDGSGDGGAGSVVHAHEVTSEDLMLRCAFCGEDSASQQAVLGEFVRDQPFILTTTCVDGTPRRRRFWAHDACARYSPEVLVTEDGQWYNVAAALRRSRAIKCAVCKRRGATVGCFYDRCQKSYHVACTRMPRSFFAEGRIFWCPKHAAVVAGASAASDGGVLVDGWDASTAPAHPVQCANCSHKLTGDLMWMVCLECPSEPAQRFNVCLACYESKDALVDHPHKRRCFREHLAHAAGVSSTGQYLDEIAGTSASGRRRRLQRKGTCCHYCRSRQSRRWRKGYGGVIMCERCFGVAHSLHGGNQAPTGTVFEQDLLANDNDSPEQLEVVALNPFGSSMAAGHDSQQGTSVEDYTQGIYFTREACVAPNRISNTLASQQPLGELSSYGPTDSMLFTLIVDSTYYDIPGRAPRWGSHSGTDYHGTWLPQTVRRAILRYTRRGERVLSNFLGRGTDAIECFLLSRKCVGVDINPSAVSLSQRNCSFAITPGVDMSVEFRPTIMQGDARDLSSEMWPGASYFAEPESFDHILSHPPYKDCVLYSTNIDGDLSRFPGPEEFQREMKSVADESWRLLKMDRHLTLGIGDNRAECFYIPVSYQLIRNYISSGFELEELIVKRQRYCQAFGLGTYLCVQFDFLMFTHEFIATLRKVPRSQIDPMHLDDSHYAEDVGLGFHASAECGSGAETTCLVTVSERVLREVPASPIDRKSVVMGSVWTFESHPAHSFPHLCASRMVERFGRDGTNWEQIDLALLQRWDTDHAGGMHRGTGGSEGEAAVGTADESQSESESEFPNNGTRAGGYERKRQRQIQENREQLLNLGLVSELGEDSTDIAHYRKLVAMTPRLPIERTPLALIVVPHLPNTAFARRHVEPYRRALVQIVHDASARLCPSGLLVLGVQDVRDEYGKLWPLGMLVLEDVQRAIGSIRLRLKEFIVVVENGHARKRDEV